MLVTATLSCLFVPHPERAFGSWGLLHFNSRVDIKVEVVIFYASMEVVEKTFVDMRCLNYLQLLGVLHVCLHREAMPWCIYWMKMKMRTMLLVPNDAITTGGSHGSIVINYLMMLLMIVRSSLNSSWAHIILLRFY